MFEFAASMFIIAVAAIFAAAAGARRSGTPPEVRRYGPLDPASVCPYCSEQGGVHARMAHRRLGISTPKLIAGVLTGGLALLAVGVHRHEAVREAHCMRCAATWNP